MTADTQAPAPAADALPRDPRIRIVADAMCAKRQDLIAQPLSFIWEALAEAALAASPTPSLAPSDAQAALGHLYEIATSVGGDIAGDIRHHANTIMWAMTSPVQASPGVKELVWEHRPYAPSPWIASSAVGDYRIQGLGWRLNDGPWSGGMDDVEAAKAAAQADFTRRIQSCVTTPLAGEAGAVEALRKYSDAATPGNAWFDGDTADLYFSHPVNSSFAGDSVLVARCSTGDHYVRNARFLAECVNFVRSALSLTPPKAETETVSGERDLTDEELWQLGCDFHEASVNGELAPAETASERERLVEALRRSAQGWANVIELGLLPAQHVTTAQDLHDAARAALSTETGR